METKFNLRAALDRMDAVKARIGEIADGLENDKSREAYTEVEQSELNQLTRELSILEAKVKANTTTITVTKRSNTEQASGLIRESINAGKRVELKFRRDDPVAVPEEDTFGGNMSTYPDGLSGTNPFGITSHDIVEPLFKQSILSVIGSPLLTGLKGNHQWPVVEAFSATINDEGVALGDTQIPVSKLIAKPERIGIAVPITREAINETNDIVRLVATQYIPEAVAELMNDIMFSPTAVTGATNLVGPFITANMRTASKKTYTGDLTLKKLTELKGIVAKTNVKGKNPCFVMNAATAAELEGTPRWSGASAAIMEDGKIAGIPVYTYNGVADGTVLYGDFYYAPQGLFGDMSLIIDPYTQSRKNAIDFVLNVNYSITVLRQEAFAILTKTS